MMSRYASVAAAIALLGVFVLVPAPAHAQRTETGVGGTTYAPPVRSYVRRVPASGVRVNVNRTGVARSIGTSGRGRRRADASAFDNDNVGFSGAGTNLEQLLNITPNSGFNWQYVNAINQDLPLKALVDPVTQLEIAQAERLLRTTGGGVSGAYILGGGYPYYVPSESEGEQPATGEESQTEASPAQNPQPQIIVLQQAPAQQAAAQPAEEVSPEEQVPDRGELTLVLRNGEQIKALAFTHLNDKIVYITPDGGRKTIDAAALDPDATVRVNQDRGTPLQLPL